jgi:hypothetical protein
MPYSSSYEHVGVETIEEATGEPVAELYNKSDNDISEAPPPEGDPQEQEDAADSVFRYHSHDCDRPTDRTGEIHVLESTCRVLMATKTPEGQALFC